MNQLFAIALGGALGAIVRHFIGLWLKQSLGEGFPWGTVTVNLLGCFVIGLLFHLFEVRPLGPNGRLFIFTGLLGALTTFSTYGLDTVKLFQAGETGTAVLYILISNAGGILLLLTGIGAGRLITISAP